MANKGQVQYALKFRDDLVVNITADEGTSQEEAVRKAVQARPELLKYIDRPEDWLGPSFDYASFLQRAIKQNPELRTDEEFLSKIPLSTVISASDASGPLGVFWQGLKDVIEAGKSTYHHAADVFGKGLQGGLLNAMLSTDAGPPVPKQEHAGVLETLAAPFGMATGGLESLISRYVTGQDTTDPTMKAYRAAAENFVSPYTRLMRGDTTGLKQALMDPNRSVISDLGLMVAPFSETNVSGVLSPLRAAARKGLQVAAKPLEKQKTALGLRALLHHSGGHGYNEAVKALGAAEKYDIPLSYSRGLREVKPHIKRTVDKLNAIITEAENKGTRIPVADIKQFMMNQANELAQKGGFANQKAAAMLANQLSKGFDKWILQSRYGVNVLKKASERGMKLHVPTKLKPSEVRKFKSALGSEIDTAWFKKETATASSKAGAYYALNDALKKHIDEFRTTEANPDYHALTLLENRFENIRNLMAGQPAISSQVFTPLSWELMYRQSPGTATALGIARAAAPRVAGLVHDIINRRQKGLHFIRNEKLRKFLMSPEWSASHGIGQRYVDKAKEEVD